MKGLLGKLVALLALCSGPLCVTCSVIASVAPLGVDAELPIKSVGFAEHAVDVRHRPLPDRQARDVAPLTDRPDRRCSIASVFQGIRHMPAGHRLPNGLSAPLQT
ncbi:MAG: hypothetical protein AB7U20_01880 [Planctomycetaceae bacterium]